MFTSCIDLLYDTILDPRVIGHGFKTLQVIYLEYILNITGTYIQRSLLNLITD